MLWKEYPEWRDRIQEGEEAVLQEEGGGGLK